MTGSETGAEGLKQVFIQLVHVLKDRGMTPDELIDVYDGVGEVSRDSVPLGIFATKLSPSEALSKYLREELSLSFKEIAALLNRDERSVWTNYRRSREKMAGRFPDSVKKTSSVPIKIFADRRLSILENLVIYLVDATGHTKYRIAKSLDKAPSMIYTIYNRAVLKK